MHSPDRLYRFKLARIRQVYWQARQSGGKTVLLSLDEHLVGRYPTLARCYSQKGAAPLLARQYAGYNSMLRLIGCLDAWSGAVLVRRFGSISLPQFLRFLLCIEEQYPQAQEIFVAVDNWSVHVSPKVQEALCQRGSKICLLFLPTYAPWTNPIEKLWGRFQQEVSHMHQHWAKWNPWRERIDDWIASLPFRAQEMYHLTGLASLFYLYNPY